MAEDQIIQSFDPGAIPSPSDPCPFCNIASAYEPYDPLHPPSPPPPPTTSPSSTSSSLTSHPPSPLDPTKVTPNAYILLSTPHLLAFLDIQPLSPGHLLLCPRAHRQKLTDVTDQEAKELGAALRILSKALVTATGTPDWNVVQNNGAAAAQVVGHVHYHVIPRPEIRASGRFAESFTMFGRGVRGDLDEEEAVGLAERLREGVARVLREEKGRREKL